MMQQTDTTLLLDLDERNLAQFLSALALTAIARRVKVEHTTDQAVEARRCWWLEKPGQFAIQTEFSHDKFRSLLFDKASNFLKAMKWHSGLGGASSGLVTSGDEIGVNPFVALSGEAENSPLKVFSGNQGPDKILNGQKDALPDNCTNYGWLQHLAHGECRWGFDCRVRMHASDTGYSPDAEGTGDSNPFYPAIEMLSLAAAAFFVPAQAWQTERNALQGFAWSKALPLPMASLAATGRIHGLSGRWYAFTYRPAAHGDGGKYKFFPPATLQQPSKL